MTALDFEILPVGDQGLMLSFGEIISDEIHAKVLAADAAVQTMQPTGFTETIPSFASLFVGYDPLVTDAETFAGQLKNISTSNNASQRSSTNWQVPVCFDEDFAMDLAEVAKAVNMSEEAVINAHLGGEYQVYMYGFAPGYAYLGGLPQALQLPRKSEPVRDIAAGSVLIAGPQCLVTTLKMPTGWWIIGRSPFPILRPKAENPFPIEVGDTIHFYRVSREAYEAYEFESAL